jgi:hypothetical protein
MEFNKEKHLQAAADYEELAEIEHDAEIKMRIKLAARAESVWVAVNEHNDKNAMWRLDDIDAHIKQLDEAMSDRQFRNCINAMMIFGLPIVPPWRLKGAMEGILYEVKTEIPKQKMGM